MELQETRRHILEILKEEEACTVDELVTALAQRINRDITTVTVRHHLERLRADHLVKEPQVRRRNGPGRPQYTYSLSDQAYEVFPNNYAGLADHLVAQMKAHLPPAEVNVIFEDMADDLAQGINIPADASLKERLQQTVAYLNTLGYAAHMKDTEGGYLLSTTNCPYERVASHHEEMCQFDLRLVSTLVGIVPRFVGNMRQGEATCQYFIPAE